MKLDKIGIIVSIVAGVVAIWYYLRGTPTSNLVTYPNTQASGQPASQNPATVYNIAAPSPLPSPNLIYGNPPPLPATPAYQSFNYSPINILGLTPQGAAAVTVPTPGSPADLAAKAAACGCGGASSACGCGSCSTGGTYQDGSGQTCTVANPAEQARAGAPALYQALQNNINSSVVGGDSSLPNPVADNIASVATIPAQAQGLSQGQAATPANFNPFFSSPFLTWQQFETLASLNPGA